MIFSTAAIEDLERLRAFLQPKNPVAAGRASSAIIQSLQAIGELTHIGRPVDGLPEDYRDWLIDFGDSGYVARYRVDGDTVVVLGVRHQKEAGFS